MQRRLAPFGLAAALYLLVAIALTWPLVLHAGSRVPNDLGDSLLNTLLLDWNARVVPFTARWWNLPQFHPLPGVTAFSEHLLGLAPLTTPVIWASGNPLLAYNAAFLLSFPLCALAAHLLCFSLTRRHDASLLAGLAFGFAPYRMAQFAHVQVLSAYWIPLSLLGLHRFLATGRWRWAVLFAASWWFQALANGYYLFYLGVLIGLWVLWFVAGRGRWAALWRILGAWAVAALAFLPVALGYLKWQRAYGFRRWPDEIQAFSGDIASLLTAPANLRLWGWLQAVNRPESEFFPGATLLIVLLAGIAVAWSTTARLGLARLRTPRILLAAAALFGAVALMAVWYPWSLEVGGVRLLSVRTPQKPLSVAVVLAAAALALHPSVRGGWRTQSPLAFYTIAAVCMWLLALGPAPTFMHEPVLYKAPYAWLMLVPGVDGVRVPARFWVLATACLSVAAGLAYVHLVSRWPAVRAALPGAVAALFLIEAWPQPLRLVPPPAPRPVHASAEMRLELPLAPAYDLVALYRAAAHRRPLVNGYSGYFAPHYPALQHLLEQHDPDALLHLRSLGTLEALVDRDRDPSGREAAYLAAQPGAELVHRDGGYTVYRLPRVDRAPPLPAFRGTVLPIAGVTASLYQDLVPLMSDGDRISRWHTGGPQDPSNEMRIDLGGVHALEGLQMEIAGYVADFPRELSIELSEDGGAWRPAWTGRTGLAAVRGALAEPLTVPLRFPLGGAPARYIRLRQHARERIYYWSIAELRVFGTNHAVR